MVAALIFTVAALVAIGFQLALTAGAPWGEYAMGGRYPGRFPIPLRVGALVQAAVIAVLAIIVLGRAGLVSSPLDAPWLIWAVVIFSAFSVALNALSRSPGERRLWVPVAVAMLGASFLVATS